MTFDKTTQDYLNKLRQEINRLQAIEDLILNKSSEQEKDIVTPAKSTESVSKNLKLSESTKARHQKERQRRYDLIANAIKENGGSMQTGDIVTKTGISKFSINQLLREGPFRSERIGVWEVDESKFKN